MLNKDNIIYCDDCKHEFSMNAVNIKDAIVNIHGKVLKLMYFVCPKCNKIYRISLKDKQYDELKKDLERAAKRMQKAYNSGNEELASTLNSVVNKKHKRLKDHLINLDKKYPGTFTFVTLENNYKEKNIKYLP